MLGILEVTWHSKLRRLVGLWVDPIVGYSWSCFAFTNTCAVRGEAGTDNPAGDGGLGIRPLLRRARPPQLSYDAYKFTSQSSFGSVERARAANQVWRLREPSLPDYWRRHDTAPCRDNQGNGLIFQRRVRRPLGASRVADKVEREKERVPQEWAAPARAVGSPNLPL